MQMPISIQRKLRLLVLLQKKYLYTCKNIVLKYFSDGNCRLKLFNKTNTTSLTQNFYSLAACELQFPAKSVLHPF